MEAVRLLIVEDHPVYRDGLRTMIAETTDLLLLAEKENGQQALQFLESHTVDVVLLDINMPILSGLETVPLIQKRYPNLGIIMLTIYDEPQLILKLLDLGVAGYVLKEANGKEIRDAIRTVANGSTYYGIEIMKKVSQHLQAQFKQPPLEKPRLTPRENEVLQLIIQEFTTPEIANKLFISTETVDTHRKNIREKLGVKNTAGIVREAIRWELVNWN